jgi:hypothetical protein
VPGSGPNLPSSGVDDSSIGTIAWTNTGDVTAEDGNAATASLINSDVSHYLKITDFGLNAQGAMLGVSVAAKRFASGGMTIVDKSVKLVVGGAITGTEHKQPDAWPSSPGWITYGGALDLWGVGSLTVVQVVASDFGIAISCECTGGGPGSGDASVDVVTMTVFYAPIDSTPQFVTETLVITDSGKVGVAGTDSILWTESGVFEIRQTESVVISDPIIDRVFEANELLTFAEIAYFDNGLVRAEGPLAFSETADRIGQATTEALTHAEAIYLAQAISQSVIVADAAAVTQSVATTETLTHSEPTPRIALAGVVEAVSTSDFASLQTVFDVSEIAAATEAASPLQAAIAGAELLAASETSGISQAAAESLTGAEAAVLAPAAGVTETCLVIDAFSYPLAIAVLGDTLAIDESANIRLASAEALVGADAASVAAGAAAAESMVLVEAASLPVAVLTAADAITIEEGSPPRIGVASGESPAISDTALPLATATTGESVAVTEAAPPPGVAQAPGELLSVSEGSPAVGVASVENPAITDAAAAPTASLAVVQAAAFSEDSLVQVTHVLIEAAAISDAGLVAAGITVADQVVATVAVLTAAQLAPAESVAITDAAAVAAAIAATESVAGTDTGVVILQKVTTESLGLTETGGVTAAQLSVAEALTGVESVAPIRVSITELAAIADAALAPVARLTVAEGMNLVEVGTVADTTLRMMMVTAIRVRPAIGGTITIRPA